MDRACGNATSSQGTTQDEIRIEKHGMQGEQAVMQALTRIPMLIVYWNMGIRVGSSRCEVDHLVLTPEGAIIVETKNLKGHWKALAQAERPDEWIRVDNDNQKSIRSPFMQVSRTSSILVRLLKTLGLFIPVRRIVVFADDTVTLPDIIDDRAIPCRRSGLENCINDCRADFRKENQKAKPESLLKFMAFLSKESQDPAFYDRRIFLEFIQGEDALRIDPRKILEALFAQIPVKEFWRDEETFRPRAVSEDSFPRSFKDILDSFESEAVRAELRLAPTGMACDPAELIPN